MNKRRIIEDGLTGLFVVALATDRYLPHVALVAIPAAIVYWWPDTKIILIMVGTIFGLSVALIVLLVSIGAMARAAGYQPDLGFSETPKEDG